MAESSSLKYDDFTAAVDDGAAAFRSKTRLQPIGGKGDKIFPPTYTGSKYAKEQRRGPDGQRIDCVILDSVQSQANRLEQSLKNAWEDGVIEFPVMQVDFTEPFPDIGVITSLDAPHRIADAVFRESNLGGQPFRNSQEGERFEKSNLENANAIYELCPTALVFGTWDSTGAEGGLGNKFARCLVSEIIGFDAVEGVRPAGRLSPLGITGTRDNLYETPDNRITYDKSEAAEERGNPVKAKPSDVNLGNIPPSLTVKDSGPKRHGGVTIDYAEQTVVLTLAGLRKLRFPTEQGDRSSGRDALHHRVIAALGLASVVFQHRTGFDLRSRCALVPESPPQWELVAHNGQTTLFDLNVSDVVEIYERAVDEAREEGISWPKVTIELEPREPIVRLIRESRGLVEDE